MNKIKLVCLGLLLLLVSLACVITLPAPGSNAPAAVVTVNSPLPSSTPSRTPKPSGTPFPTPTRRATSAEFSTIIAEQTVALPPSLTSAVAVETVQGGALATPTLLGAVGYSSATPPALKCKVEVMQPAFGADLKPRTDFMAAWRLYNIGSAPWPAGEVTFEFVEGDKLHPLDYIPEILSFSVFPKDRVRFDIRLKSPKAPGRYTTTWGIIRSQKKGPFCTFSITIDVVK